MSRSSARISTRPLSADATLEDWQKHCDGYLSKWGQVQYIMHSDSARKFGQHSHDFNKLARSTASAIDTITSQAPGEPARLTDFDAPYYADSIRWMESIGTPILDTCQSVSEVAEQMNVLGWADYMDEAAAMFKALQAFEDSLELPSAILCIKSILSHSSDENMIDTGQGITTVVQRYVSAYKYLRDYKRSWWHAIGGQFHRCRELLRARVNAAQGLTQHEINELLEAMEVFLPRHNTIEVAKRNRSRAKRQHCGP